MLGLWVGTFAIQLAKLMGATVAMTASSAGTDLVKSFGADEFGQNYNGVAPSMDTFTCSVEK